MLGKNTQKGAIGNFFDDFQLGQIWLHGRQRTATESDQSQYLALTGSRYDLHCNVPLAQQWGYRCCPLDDLLAFHLGFALTVQDISLHAVANLGYAEWRFLAPVYPGDTLHACSEIIGLRANKNLKSGIVYVRSTVFCGTVKCLQWVRWVMVRRRPEKIGQPWRGQAHIPQLQDTVASDSLLPPSPVRALGELAIDALEALESPFLWQDYRVGEWLNVAAGMAINDSDHMHATRLYQNNARVHFDRAYMQQSRELPPLVYGGHVLSLCRALAYPCLGSARWLLAVHSGSHLRPVYAGDTLYCAHKVLKCQPCQDKRFGVLRLHLIGYKNKPINGDEELHADEDAAVLSLDYSVLVPRRP